MKKILSNTVKIAIGYSRTVVHNIVNQQYFFIPNNEIQELTESKFELVCFDTLKNLEITNSIIDHVHSRFLDVPISKFEFPGLVSNSVVIVGTNNTREIINFIKRVGISGCKSLTLIVAKCKSEDDIFTILESTNHTQICEINLFVNADGIFNINEIAAKLSMCQVQKVVFFNCIQQLYPKYQNCLINISSISTNAISCGFPFISNFNFSAKFFHESLYYNTCLNRKLCIDKDGYIKNCPYMEQHYGHISNTKIEDVVKLPEFQKWWHIKKDDIDVCKDCEFRHMCTDCRAFIKDLENIYSQPAKCTYNPYICKWEGEEGYVPVEECGTYSRETGFVPDKKKIKKLNKQIWGDE